MARVLARSLVAGACLFGIGLCLLILSDALDHYDLWRMEWYVGEAGVGALMLGGVLLLTGIVVNLWQTRGGNGG